MTTPTDNDLIKQALGGDKRSFEALYQRYQARIFNFIFRFLGDAGLAEEVTQNTFLSVYRNLHRYRPGKSAKAWIYHIAKNLAINRYHAEKKSRKTTSIDAETTGEALKLSEHLRSNDLNPEEALRRRELHAEIQKVINRLPEKYRLVLILHDVEGLSYAEIQKVLRIPYFSAATRLTRARAMFRKLVDPKRFGLHLFFFINPGGGNKMKFELGYLRAGNLSRFIDNELPSRESERMQERMANVPFIRDQIRALEETKILLKETPMFYPTPAFITETWQLIEQEPPMGVPWFSPVLAPFEALGELVLTLPRAAVICSLLTVLLAPTIAKTIQIESTRTLRVASVEGDPHVMVDNAQRSIVRGQTIQLNQPIVTAMNETVILRRPGLFTIQLAENSQATVRSFSYAGFGQNKIDLRDGTLLFQTEEALTRGDFAINTPWFLLTHQGTVAFTRMTSEGFEVAVLEGSVSLKPLSAVSREAISEPLVFVNALEQFTFRLGRIAEAPKPISEFYLKKLIDFVPSEKLVILALPQEKRAAALVDREDMSVALAFFNINPKRKALLEEATRLFQQTDELPLRRSRAIVAELAERFKQEDRRDISVSLYFFVVAISAYIEDDQTASDILGEMSKDKAYTNETRALAYTALGIIDERQDQLDSAKKAYETVVKKFGETAVAQEARERLAALH